MINNHRQNYLTPEMDHPRSAFHHYGSHNQPLQTVYEQQQNPYRHYHQYNTASTNNTTKMNNENHQITSNEANFDGFAQLEREFIFNLILYKSTFKT